KRRSCEEIACTVDPAINIEVRAQINAIPAWAAVDRVRSSTCSDGVITSTTKQAVRPGRAIDKIGAAMAPDKLTGKGLVGARTDTDNDASGIAAQSATRRPDDHRAGRIAASQLTDHDIDRVGTVADMHKKAVALTIVDEDITRLVG